MLDKGDKDDAIDLFGQEFNTFRKLHGHLFRNAPGRQIDPNLPPFEQALAECDIFMINIQNLIADGDQDGDHDDDQDDDHSQFLAAVNDPAYDDPDESTYMADVSSPLSDVQVDLDDSQCFGAKLVYTGKGRLAAEDSPYDGKQETYVCCCRFWWKQEPHE